MSGTRRALYVAVISIFETERNPEILNLLSFYQMVEQEVLYAHTKCHKG